MVVYKRYKHKRSHLQYMIFCGLINDIGVHGWTIEILKANHEVIFIGLDQLYQSDLFLIDTS